MPEHLHITQYGSGEEGVYHVTPLTEVARIWLSRNLPGGLTWWAGGCLIEPPIVTPLLERFFAYLERRETRAA